MKIYWQRAKRRNVLDGRKKKLLSSGTPSDEDYLHTNRFLSANSISRVQNQLDTLQSDIFFKKNIS